ncbi:FliM/FliN family flagellar motor switch protein [bacterium]|nr:FliM/FliN family flagellar motor switch protein [bacterium]
MEDRLQNSISTDQLFKEYNWFNATFPKVIQESFNEFFNPNFRLELMGISKNINCLITTESCFVTKIRINTEYDMFFRFTDRAIDIILNKILGQSKNKFNINKISELEAKIITSFNDFMFEHLKPCLSAPPQNEIKRINFDLIHLTFLIKETEEYNKKTGKIVVTLPIALLKPELVKSKNEKFSENDFPTSTTIAKALIGKTKFSLHDLKNLEIDDVVVFENSNLENITITVNGQELPVKLNPNMDILIPQEDDGGEHMSEAHNLWDSIEVEMNAEFDAVKLSLGELKNIEEGLVVDLASLYENNVTLKVEGKSIASGTLVIVNDRYGVKINNVIAESDGTVRTPAQNQNSDNESEEYEENSENNSEEDNGEYYDENTEYAEGAEGGEEEFDYSDFELEDENI